MPLYEYFCPTCNRTFEQLRPAPKADEAATCPACQQAAAQRVLSLFASSVKGNDGAMPAMSSAMPMGGGCCGGSCGCHN
ncbi:MAG: zinc ribbon domain-containing protein [Caldilineaceae bacterium]|nr:zinc ribbon domain-containing protein [Caldilineaceae bacterium]